MSSLISRIRRGGIPSHWVLAVTIMLLLGGCSSALAGPTLVTDRYPLAGKRSELALDGPTVLVGGYESETTNVVRAFTPGQSPKTIARATIKPQSGEFSDAMYFAASDARLIMLDFGSGSVYKGSGGLSYERLLTGRLGGPLSELPNTCAMTPTLDPGVTGEAGIPAHSAIAVDGNVVAYDSYGCVVAKDFATGLRRVVKLDATLSPVIKGSLQRSTEGTTLRVVGRLLAYRENPPGGEGPASVAVYDIDTGRELYRAPLPVGAPTFDLQADGTLLIAVPSSCVATISTIAEPAPRPLGVPACRVRRVYDNRALLVIPGDGTDRQLAWISLQAPGLHPIEDLGPGGVLESAPADMDGASVIYTQSGCWAPKIYRTSLLEPGAPPIVSRTCPISVPSAVATLTAKTLRVRLHCPLGCRGNLNARVGVPKQVRKPEDGQSVVGIGLPNVAIRPGGSATLTLLPHDNGEEMPTARALVRRLRRARRLDLRLEFRIDTPVAEGLPSEETTEESGWFGQTFTHVVIPIRLQASSPHRGHH
jgi:hypothetical protein